MFKNIKTSPSLLFWQDIYWRSRFKDNLWSVWKFGLLCTFSILFCPTFKIQKLEWNLLETKSSFNCFNPKVHPRNNQGDRARVNLITTKGVLLDQFLEKKLLPFHFKKKTLNLWIFFLNSIFIHFPPRNFILPPSGDLLLMACYLPSIYFNQLNPTKKNQLLFS